MDMIDSSEPTGMIGARIRARRLRLGWTEAELGRKAGIGVEDISDIEKRVGPVDRTRVEAIAAALGVTSSTLLDPDPGIVGPLPGIDQPSVEEMHALVIAILALPKLMRAEVADLVAALGRRAAQAAGR